MILIFAGVSLGLAFAAFYAKNGFLKFLNVVSWIVFSFYLYKDIFGLVNLLDMSNDFLLWISHKKIKYINGNKKQPILMRQFLFFCFFFLRGLYSVFLL